MPELSKPVKEKKDDRATCWAITWNNPPDKIPLLPPGWEVDGQLEKGEKNGTPHWQIILYTPQVRWRAVKNVFPICHIEAARNKAALQNYVSKSETRVADLPQQRYVPTIFEYQEMVARHWVPEDFDKRWMETDGSMSIDDCAMEYLDDLVRVDIENGMWGPEWISINPMWRSSWKKFWRSIIKRNASPSCQAPTSQVQQEGSEEGTTPSCSSSQEIYL